MYRIPLFLLAVVLTGAATPAAAQQRIDPAILHFNAAQEALPIEDVGKNYVLAFEGVEGVLTGTQSSVIYILDRLPEDLSSALFVVRADVLSYTLQGDRPPRVLEVLKKAFARMQETENLQFGEIDGPEVGNDSVWYAGNSTGQPGAIYYLVVFEVPNGLAAVSGGVWDPRSDTTLVAGLARTMADHLEL